MAGLSVIIDTEVKEIVETYVKNLNRAVKAEAKAISNRMGESITTETKVPGKSYSVGVDADILESKAGYDFSPVFQEGRRAYTITPKKAKALHFTNKKTGDNVFTQKSSIPSMRCKDFLQSAINKTDI